ncbi:MAG: hypothetical protein K6G75_01865 [Lachnospiraceae bacterium]|nr:hypothetical protein [Lachnospiraceae bacterium]
MSKEFIVGDYMFSSLEEANIAKLELDKIEKLNEKLVGADVELLYKVYNKSIEKNTFKTPVGLEYMKAIKKKLEKSPSFKADILPIPVNALPHDELSAEERNESLKRYKNESKKYSTFFKWSLFINAVLVIVIIALFVITSTSKNPNILNYENALVDKYSAWEMELEERERAVKEKEANLP